MKPKGTHSQLGFLGRGHVLCKLTAKGVEEQIERNGYEYDSDVPS